MQIKEDEKWQKTLLFFKNNFDADETVELDVILFLIGVQELGKISKKFKKDEKMNLIHVAVCTLLEPYGFYTFDYYDNEGWPHFKLNEDLPHLKANEQQILIKKAIIEYLEKDNLI
ncbi:MAG: hypothetical protein ACEQSF_05060 [Solirubrobacteraceae bacterium]